MIELSVLLHELVGDAVVEILKRLVVRILSQIGRSVGFLFVLLVDPDFAGCVDSAKPQFQFTARRREDDAGNRKLRGGEFRNDVDDPPESRRLQLILQTHGHVTRLSVPDFREGACLLGIEDGDVNVEQARFRRWDARSNQLDGFLGG